MPLFKCMLCGCLENNHLVNKKRLPLKNNIYNKITGEMMLPLVPCMDFMDMQGVSGDRIMYNGFVWKEADEIRMLCSECNTGEWHNEFEKELCSNDESEVAMYSKYNMTTPFDHEEGCLIITETNNSQYKVHETYKVLHEIFRKEFNKKHTDHMSDFKENYFYLVYLAFKQDPMNFRPYHGYDDMKWDDEYEVALYIFDSLVYEYESKSSIVKYLRHKYLGSGDGSPLAGPLGNILGYTGNSLLSDIDGLLGTNLNNFFNPVKKPHWKELQSDTEKNEKLRKAEEKRLRKMKARGK